jgi:hypothetical protein
MTQNNNNNATIENVLVKQPYEKFLGNISSFIEETLLGNNIEPDSFYLTINKNSAKLLEQYPEKIDWVELGENHSCVNLIEKDLLDKEGNLKLNADGLIDFASSDKEEPEKVHVMIEYILKNPNACHLIRKIIEQRKKLPKLAKRGEKEDDYYPLDDVQIMADMPNFWCRIADNHSEEAIQILKENWKEFDLSDDKIRQLIKDEQQYTQILREEGLAKYNKDCRELEEKKEKIRIKEAEKQEQKKANPNIVFNEEDDDYDIEDLDEVVDIDDYEIPIVLSDEEIEDFIREYREKVDDHWNLETEKVCKKYRVHPTFDKIDDSVYNYLEDYILRERNVWECLSGNPFAFELLQNNIYKICFDRLAGNNAMKMINKLKKKYPEHKDFLESRLIIEKGDIVELEDGEHQNIGNKINFELFSMKEDINHILQIMKEDEEANRKPRIKYQYLLANETAIDWIEENIEKIKQELPQTLNINDGVPHCENWCYLSLNSNPKALEYLSKNIHLIDRKLIWANKGIFTFNINKFQEDPYLNAFKQDLQSKTLLHPKNVENSLNEIFNDPITGKKYRHDYTKDIDIFEDEDEF